MRAPERSDTGTCAAFCAAAVFELARGIEDVLPVLAPKFCAVMREAVAGAFATDRFDAWCAGFVGAAGTFATDGVDATCAWFVGAVGAFAA